MIPGGVNSPVRAFGAVGRKPFVTTKAKGAYIYDIDGNRYVDYVMSWGPLPFGHAFSKSIEAITRTARHGLSFGTVSRGEFELCNLVKKHITWIDMVRLVSSGTEACMTAIRLARGFTGRKLIVKFDGGYHGHSDSFLVRAGSGLATGGIPASAGVPSEISTLTISIPYNDLEAVKNCFDRHGEDIAAVIVEPAAGNMGVIPPAEGFLELLRTKTAESGSVLIFDEVITGFRVAPGGAAELYGIIPDIACYGKILGGGMPIGAVAGKQAIMEMLAPIGPVYQAGTLSGNPISAACGAALLKRLNKRIYRQLEDYAIELTESLKTIAGCRGIPLVINRAASLFTLYFSRENIDDFAAAQRTDMKLYAGLFGVMLDNGVFIPPSGYEAWFVSTAHGAAQLKQTLRAFERFAVLYGK